MECIKNQPQSSANFLSSFDCLELHASQLRFLLVGGLIGGRDLPSFSLVSLQLVVSLQRINTSNQNLKHSTYPPGKKILLSEYDYHLAL
jgi:hypothetical protein